MATVTWKVGDPCPLCGQAEPHSTVHDHNGTYCEPSNSRATAARVYGDLLFGLKEAEHLGFDEQRIRARIAELELAVEQGGRIYHHR